jgi:hypothetical protein
MAPQVVKTLLRADGKRRVVIIQREEGLFGFREEQFITSPAGERWGRLAPYSTICDTAEAAEREARAAVPWLRSAG